MLNLQLDFRSGIPITNQIVEQVQHLIAIGELKAGDQLPTVRILAQELQVTFNTVARAYRTLDQVAIISTQQGRGTYILEQPPPEVNERLRQESLEALARRYVNETKRLGFDNQQIETALKKQFT